MGLWFIVFIVEYEYSIVMVISEEFMVEVDFKFCLIYLIGDFVFGFLSRVRIVFFLKLKNWVLYLY